MISTLSKVDEKVLEQIEEEKKIRKTTEVFLLFALGSQFDHLIKQMLDKLGVFCIVVDPSRITVEDIKRINPIGIILSGGPASVYEKPPPLDRRILDLGIIPSSGVTIPVLGICLGFQLWGDYIGCKVKGATKKEYGVHKLAILKDSPLFKGCKDGMLVLESHGDIIEAGGKNGMSVLARTDNSPVAAGQYKDLYGVQFHPEVSDTENGLRIFENFCFEICKAKDRFPATNIAQQKISILKEQIGDKKGIIALSGGNDSSVAAYLLKAALAGRKGQLRGVYIKGLDREDDEARVLKYFGNQDWIDLKIIDGTERFLAALKGKYKAQEKRRAMKAAYKEILEEEIKIFGAEFIVQGTLYTDISETGLGYNIRNGNGGADCNGQEVEKAQIKEHHNVGIKFIVDGRVITEITPLDDCVKDTCRDIGRSIGVPEEILTQYPFPGPGLSVRIENEVTAEKLRIARRIDGIYIEELRKANLYHGVWQGGAYLTESVVTCTKGDGAMNGLVVILWAVWSVNGFTAQAAELPWDFLKHVATRITNEVPEIGSVEYRISSKPPSTIEFQ